MARLDMILDRGEGDVPRVNFIVVPGIAGANLDDRTCPHFRGWLDRLVVDCKSRAQSWAYYHHIEISRLESWDLFSSTGDDLYAQFMSMQREQRFRKDDTLILIGHKMGCYILKKALVDACQKENRPEEKQFLDMIETIVMVGEPNLQPDNQWEWFDLISRCVSVERPLPKKLTNNLSVGVLQHISNTFEDVLLYSTIFDVSGPPRAKPKHRFMLRRTEHDGCICSATINVRVYTTASEEILLEKGQGDEKVCPFHPQSTHFKNLLMLNAAPGLAQITQGEPQINSPIVQETVHSMTVHRTGFQDQVKVETDHYDQMTSTYIVSPSSPENTIDLPSTQTQISRVLKSDVIDGQQFYVSSMDQRILNDGPESNIVDLSVPCSSQSDSSQNIKDEPLPGPISDCLVNTADQVASVLSSNFVVADAYGNQEDVQNTKIRRKRKSIFSGSLPLRDEFFYGRDAILELLSEDLIRICSTSRSDGIQHNKPTIICLTGPGGTGKSTIAVEHFYRSMKKVDHVLWLSASSQASLGIYCHDFAVALGLVQGRSSQNHEASRLKFIEWLESSGKTFLLVFDDIRSSSDWIPYIPQCGNGSIIITSRYELPKNLGGSLVQTIPVPAWNNVDAAKFLYRAVFHREKHKQVEELCLAVHRYHASPLVLKLLVNWSIRHEISITDIITLLGAREISRSLYNPISDLISLRIDELDATEMSLFHCLCFFDSVRVQNKILLGAERLDDLPLRYFPRNSQEYFLRQLWNSSLIEIDESRESCSVQGVVQDIVQARMDYDTWNNSIRTAASLVRAQWPSRRKLRNVVNGYWPEFDSLHLHVHSMARSCENKRMHKNLDPGDDFKTLLLNSTWFNTRRGNQAEDRDLINLAYALLSASHDNEMNRITSVPLPRRCLYVGSDSRKDTPYLVDTNRRHGSYVALSYVWGNGDASTSPWRLTSRTINHFKQGFDVNDLPTNVRDAITVTRNLGISYLWIDSFCIIQDVPEDVAEEIMRLGDYYANSVMIIAENRRAPSIASIQESIGHRNEIIDVAQYSIYRMSPSSFHQPGFEVRGWAFQQSLLSPNSFFVSMPADFAGEHVRVMILVNASSEYDDSFEGDTTARRREITASITTEDAANDTETPLAIESESQVRYADAQSALNKGQNLLLQSSYIEATATLMLSRDLLGPLQATPQDVLDMYGMATSMLGTAYHLLNLDSAALDILDAGNNLYMRLASSKGIQDPVNGRLSLSAGICMYGLGKFEESQERLKAARDQSIASDGKPNEWSAAIDIKLADCYMSTGKAGEARILLQSALDFFQATSMETKERHLARILHRQSLVYQSEGNGIMCSAFTAAARDALAQAMRANETTTTVETSSLATVPLNRQVFDDLIEPWYR